jgi:hypothetical protein
MDDRQTGMSNKIIRLGTQDALKEIQRLLVRTLFQMGLGQQLIGRQVQRTLPQNMLTMGKNLD